MYISSRPTANPPHRGKMSTRNVRKVSTRNLVKTDTDDDEDVCKDSDEKDDSDNESGSDVSLPSIMVEGQLFPRDLGIEFLEELK